LDLPGSAVQGAGQLGVPEDQALGRRWRTDDYPLIVGRHDGTPAGKETREDTLQEYLCERLEAPGIAVYDHLILTNTAVGWNLELLPRD